MKSEALSPLYMTLIVHIIVLLYVLASLLAGTNIFVRRMEQNAAGNRPHQTEGPRMKILIGMNGRMSSARIEILVPIYDYLRTSPRGNQTALYGRASCSAAYHHIVTTVSSESLAQRERCL